MSTATPNPDRPSPMKAIPFEREHHAANIKDPGRWLADIICRDWSWLKGAFLPGGMPMDIDGAYERRGHFLGLENKHINGKLHGGQEIFFRQAVRSGQWTIFIIWRNDRHQVVRLTFVGTTLEKDRTIDADEQSVFDECAGWFRWANGNQLSLPS